MGHTRCWQPSDVQSPGSNKFVTRAFLWGSMAWELQAVCRLSADFDVASHSACRCVVQTWAKEQGLAVKMKSGRVAGANVILYVYCKTHTDCPVVWRHTFDVAEAGTKEHTIHMKGAHAEGDRLVRGTPVTVRRQAETLTASNTPTQALVQLSAQGVDVANWPSHKTLQQARVKV